ARNTGVQKGSKMALGCWRTGSLNSHGEHHFANRRAAARGLQTTGLINESDQIQLLSDPYQGTDVADQSRPDGTGRSQVGECLPRDWAHVGIGAEGRAGTV